MKVIEVSNFAQHFKKFSISDINFFVNKGTIHALIGESGSGKSVILQSIIGALPNYKGAIKIFNYDVKTALSKIRLGFSTNLEDFPSEMSAYRFLLLLGSLSGIKIRNIKNNIKFLMMFFDLWKYKDKKLKFFSSGMKNRIMIIHALITNPDIAIFDEPGANLDYVNRLKFYQFLAYQKKLGKTIFLTTHMIDEIEPIIDDCTIINNGKMLYSGKYNVFTNYMDYQLKVSDNQQIANFFAKHGIYFFFDEEKKEFLVALPYNININSFFAYMIKNNITVYYFKEIKNDLTQLKIKLNRFSDQQYINK